MNGTEFARPCAECLGVLVYNTSHTSYRLLSASLMSCIVWIVVIVFDRRSCSQKTKTGKTEDRVRCGQKAPAKAKREVVVNAFSASAPWIGFASLALARSLAQAQPLSSLSLSLSLPFSLSYSTLLLTIRAVTLSTFRNRKIQSSLDHLLFDCQGCKTITSGH